PLNQREAALLENLLQTGKARMQAEAGARRIGSDLQHLTGGYGERRPAAVVERIVVRHEHAQRVVAAAQIEHHEIARVRALRLREVGQELRRGERHRERGDAAFDELPSGDLHISWYSGDPARRCTSPAALLWICASA